MDEPIFMEEEPEAAGGPFEVPLLSGWVGALPEPQLPADMPRLYLDAEVAQTLHREAQRSIAEDREVAGILLGTCSHDAQIIKVSHIAIGRDEDSSPVHYKFTFTVWDDLIDQMERMSNAAGEELLLLGWYHTHPNMAVFLSRYDLRTHRDFHRPYQFALVLAPKLGTEDTKVGFFVNRRGSTPLLPGLRLFGPDLASASSLPWRFQVVEAEGVEEGEGDEEANSGDAASQAVDHTPTMHQLGTVRREDPNWLVLGSDRAEGPVLPILEAMAGQVVEIRGDRLGILLGTKTQKNHITINRVRFLGRLSEDPAQERQEILGTLRFMAETFPAHKEEKILGVVRIVSPHRFKPGDRYDPVDHNIRIAQLLGEVGYALNEVPFQVGIVLYPGIEDDTFFFQVFAQHKSSRPVPLMSMRAMAPAVMKPNERYECVEGGVFVIAEPPSMTVPVMAPLNLPAPTPMGRPLPDVDDSQVDASLMGRLDEEYAEEEEKKSSGRALLLLVAAGGGAVLLILLLLLLGPGGGSGDTATAEDVQQEIEGMLAVSGPPYEYAFTGCGAGWNPGVVCRPFSGAERRAEKAEVLRAELRESYTELTFEPLEAWLLPDDDPGARTKLERSKDGEAVVFSVGRTGDRWERLWAVGDVVSARLVMAPRGAELLIDDEMTPLRRSEPIRLSASAEGSEAGTVAPGDLPAGGGGWTFDGGAADARVAWDAAAGVLRGRPSVTGPGGGGSWTLSVHEREGSAELARAAFNLGGASTLDLTKPVSEVLRDPQAAATISRFATRDNSAVLVLALPPESDAPLRLSVRVGPATTQHRVCLMMEGHDGRPAEGRARVGEGTMRPTFDPSTDECSDGGGSGRWAPATFGPGPTRVEFVYEGSLPGYATAKDELQFGSLGERWSDPADGTRCLAITLRLGETGRQRMAPEVTPLYKLVDGKCR